MFEKYASLQPQHKDSRQLVQEKARAREHLALLISEMDDDFTYVPGKSAIVFVCKRDPKFTPRLFPTMGEYRNGNWDLAVSEAKREFRRRFS